MPPRPRRETIRGVDKSAITPSLVACLVESQFPEWAGLPITPVDHDGWDNTTYRLGDALSVRLPSAERYVPQVDKEHRWLPLLAPHLPLPIPRPLRRGEPGCGFPRPWSVYEWLPGAHATLDRVDDLTAYAASLVDFLHALHAAPVDGAPVPGRHNFLRGAPPEVYDDQAREAVGYLGDVIDGARALEVWEEACAAPFEGTPVWFHGDLSATNTLVVDGRLSAVIDFGTAAVGDPACDLAIAWTFLAGESRAVFRERLGLDEGAWARGRGWTLWKALITLAEALRVAPDEAGRAGLQFGWRQDARSLVEDLLADG